MFILLTQHRMQPGMTPHIPTHITMKDPVQMQDAQVLSTGVDLLFNITLWPLRGYQKKCTALTDFSPH